MKKNSLLIASFQFIIQTVIGCDICGCFMGITPYDNQSSIQLMHRYRSFNGYKSYDQHANFFPIGAYKVAPPAPSIMHGNHSTASSPLYSKDDYEIYKTYELRLKYFIHNRIELNAIIPINSNTSKEQGVVNSTSGIGDPTFLIGYHLIRKIDEPVIQQRLIMGLGIKLPTGDYYANDINGNRLPFLIQTGTGSIDYLSYLNYIIGYKKLGLSTNAMFKVNGKNYYDEQIANSITIYSNLFYKIPMKQSILVPSLQYYSEYTKGLTVKGVAIDGTSMNIAMLGPGLDFFHKNIGINLGFHYTINEDVSSNNLSSAGRMVIGLSYNFNQKKYLFSRKENSTN